MINWVLYSLLAEIILFVCLIVFGFYCYCMYWADLVIESRNIKHWYVKVILKFCPVVNLVYAWTHDTDEYYTEKTFIKDTFKALWKRVKLK